MTGRKNSRKHHYVPVFYQANFTNQNGLLWVYDKRARTYKELHPRVICFERDLYAVKPEDKPPDTRLETMVLAAVDGLGAKGIREFQAGRPTREAEEVIAFLLAFQYTRLPTISRDVRGTYSKSVQVFMRELFADVGRAKAIIERYGRDTSDEIDVSPESIVEAVQGEQFEIVATEVPFLKNMVEQAIDLRPLLTQLTWEVLVAHDETGFIICDSPVVIVPPKGCTRVGFFVPGSAKYFPLTRKLCLRLGEQGNLRRFRKVDKESVRVINQNVAANSERFIMGPSRVQLENVVLRSGCEDMESIPRLSFEAVTSGGQEALYKLSSHARRYFYSKNGSPFAP